MKPLILFSGTTGMTESGLPTWVLNHNYAQIVQRAGGVPLLAVDRNCVEEYADMADGLLLSGGRDVDTRLYGQEPHCDCLSEDAERDALEWKLIPAFLERKKPIFGICRGFQALNVYFGGTLYQDIPSELGGEHNTKGDLHPATLNKDSILGRLFGEHMDVNSYHHQALDALGKGFFATAWSDANGHSIVEGIEHETLPIWAVQWHPERMTGPEAPAGCVDSLPMLEYFIRQCRK
ncbi:MAG: gamma-glutamyl-gamma-aminobutyrate hydrolase family protein [Lachnospiraceae bacterium]|jgi:putative glutamine amidotransferase|nr:gamma-glutamyl-gamma-aminobutyrate hydrolase family protein [Lachnospiraceae bacterium]NBJ81835.1 gamma-glutamyl-gamma-aminobutyrate hydrolase family protein [bacterium 1XD42-76]NBK05279.1 gamma-glutamyl-gamma-aminobutyrate hydrolase family protein [bacterium 1XD42-94]